MRTLEWLSILYCLELTKYWLMIGSFARIKIKRKWMGLIGWAGCLSISSIRHIGEIEAELIMYLLVYLTVGISMVAKVKEKISFILMSILVISCAESVFGIPIGYLWNEIQGNQQVNKLKSIIISLVMLIFILVMIYLNKKLSLYSKEKHKEFIKKHLVIFMLLLSIFLAFTIGGLNYAKEKIQDREFTIIVNLISTTSFICMGLIVWIMTYVNDKNKRIEEMIKIERNLKEMQLKHYRNILEREASTRKFRHDMNNHFICLNELVKVENIVLIDEYIKDIQKHINVIKDKIYMVGNEILDALLNYHLLKLNNVKIDITGFCQKEILISNVDLCIIFGNLLQNAVEELSKNDFESKYFQLNIENGEKYTKIEIINSISEQSLIKKNFLKTSKNDRLNHGLGLENVKNAVERNEGRFKFEVKKKEFITSVILNNKIYAVYGLN